MTLLQLSPCSFLLYLNGGDLRDTTLLNSKAACTHLAEEPAASVQRACRRPGEQSLQPSQARAGRGIMAKLASGRYHLGVRTRECLLRARTFSAKTATSDVISRVAAQPGLGVAASGRSSSRMRPTQHQCTSRPEHRSDSGHRDKCG